MAGILELMGVRKELKQRVDMVVSCGNEWRATAENLTAALDKLTAAVEKGDPAPEVQRDVVKTARALSRNTHKLSRSFERVCATMSGVSQKL